VLLTAQENHITPSWISRNRTSVNQENAQHSTGPRTPSGKLRSSLNALTHGLTGRTVLLSSEDPADHQRHAQAFFNEYQPQGPTERQLVQELIDTSWRINRVPALEADVPPTWRRSATCEISHTRRGHKTLEAERRTKEERDLKRAAALLEMHKIRGIPYDPANDGFVFSNDQIEAHSQRLMRLNQSRHIEHIRFYASPAGPGQRPANEIKLN
jgi:hypothetical protein